MNNFEYIKTLDIDKMTEFIDNLRRSYCIKSFQQGCENCFNREICNDLPLSQTKEWLQKECKDDTANTSS